MSHRLLSFDLRRARLFFADPQVRLMLISVLGVTLLLFLRSFVGASDIDRQGNIVAAARAIWGSLFTVLSFLTTTGFESRDWLTMQLWSNLPAPGTILLGGGGDGRRHRHHRRRREAAAALRAVSPRAARDGRAGPSEQRLGATARATA